MSDAHIGYVLKVYPRFSETFVVTEILSREKAGERLSIFALRPTTDARFHPELSRVQAPVSHIAKLHKLTDGWTTFRDACEVIPDLAERFAVLNAELPDCDGADLVQAIEVARRAREQGITHLHAHFASLAGFVAATAARLAGLPYSVTTHAKDLFHESVDPAKLAYIVAKAQSIIAISEYNRQFLLRAFPEAASRIRLVHNGLELARFPFRAPEPIHDPVRVLAVGRLVEKKGFSLLIDAARELRDRGLNLDVRIAGDGELRADLDEQIARLNMDGIVSLLGPLAQNEVQQLLQWADVMVAPCIVGADGNADGLPTVLLEAMAAGLPCIATDVTGIGEAVHNGGEGRAATGMLLEPGRVDLLVNALVTFISDGCDRSGLATAARARIEEQFDSSRQARLLSEVTA